MFKKIPLSVLLTIQFSVQLLGTLGIVEYLCHRSNQQSVQQLTEELLSQSNQILHGKLDAYFLTAQRLNRSHIQALRSGALSLEDLDTLHRYLIAQWQLFPEMSSLLMGTPQGDFRFVHSMDLREKDYRPPEQVPEGGLGLQAGIATPENPNQLQVHSVTAAGTVGPIMFNLNKADVRDRPWYQAAIAKQGEGWSEPFQVGNGNMVAINTFVPYVDDQGKLQAVFGVNLTLERIYNYLRSVRTTDNSEIFIIDRQGRLIADSTGHNQYLEDLVPHHQVPEPSTGTLPQSSVAESANSLVSQAGQFITQDPQALDRFEAGNLQSFRWEGDRYFLRVLPYADGQGLDWLIVSVVPEGDLMGQVYKNRRYSYLLSSLALVLGGISGVWVSRRITRSLSRISETSQQLSHQDGPPHLEDIPIQTRILEVSELAAAFQKMIQKIHDADVLRQNYTHTLEREVAEKTSALTEAQRIAKVGHYAMDLPGYELHWSEQMFRLFGLDPQRGEPTFQTLMTLIHPDDRGLVSDHLETLIRTETSQVVDYRVQMPDGSCRHHEGRGVLEHDDQGNVIRVVGTIIDITERQESAQALQTISERLTLALEASGGKIWEWSAETPQEIRFFSSDRRPLAEVCNFTQCWLRVHPEDRPLIGDLRTQDPLANSRLDFEFRVVAKELPQGYRWCQMMVGLIADGQGQLAKMVGIIFDTSDRKFLEVALQESKNNLNDVLRSATAAITQSRVYEDGRWELIYVSDGCRHVCQYTAEELLTDNYLWVSRILPEDWERIQNHVFEDIFSGRSNRYEYRFRDKDGTIRWISQSHSSRYDAQGEFWLFTTVSLDINDRKEMELALQERTEELILAKDTAEAATQAKSRFLATMSHEIRTPMAGVIGMLELLLDNNLNPQQRQQAKAAQSSAQSLLGLINDILDFSKIEADRLELEAVNFNAIALICELLQGLAAKAQEKNIALILDLKQISTPWVKGDPQRLRQIFTNLIGNAIKFTEQGEILVKGELIPQDQGWEFRGTVKDSGIGIPSEKRSLLFQSFTQMDSSITRRYGGTGLGLAICRTLCEAMGGTITLVEDSEPGSCFCFTLPLEACDCPSLESQDTFGEIESSAGPLKILVADDHGLSRQILGEQLHQWSCRVSLVPSRTALLKGAKKLDSPPEKTFDLVFLSGVWLQQLSDRDRQILEQSPLFGPATTWVILHPFPTMPPLQDYPEFALAPCLSKPIDPRELWALLQCQAQDNASPHPSDRPPSLPSLDHVSLLLVEDTPINQEVIQGILEKQGVQVHCEENGHRAIAHLRTNPQPPYDVILMDCQMPELDGYETTRRIRQGQGGEAYRNVVIIAMTAHAIQEELNHCLAVGMNDYLTKPVDSRRLFQALGQWLALSAPETPAPNPDPAPDTEPQAPEIPETPEIAPPESFDGEKLMTYAHGDPDVATTICQIFLAEMEPALQDLQRAWDQRDLQLVEDLAHKLKSTVSYFGGRRFYEQAAAIELAARGGYLDQLSPQFEPLWQSFEVLAQGVRRWLAEHQ